MYYDLWKKSSCTEKLNDPVISKQYIPDARSNVIFKQNHSLMLIIGHTGAGKSLLALKIAEHMLTHLEGKVFWWGLESESMGDRNMYNRGFAADMQKRLCSYYQNRFIGKSADETMFDGQVTFDEANDCLIIDEGHINLQRLEETKNRSTILILQTMQDYSDDMAAHILSRTQCIAMGYNLDGWGGLNAQMKSLSCKSGDYSEFILLARESEEIQKFRVDLSQPAFLKDHYTN